MHLPLADLKGSPGTRAPHVALGPDRSTLDLFGREFVLLRPTGEESGEVRTHVLDGIADAYGIGPDGGVLVRPDGIVGWRSRDGFTADEVTRALDSILAR